MIGRHIMKKLQVIIFTLSLLFSVYGQAQTTSITTFKVDSSIQGRVDTQTRSINGVAFGKFDIRLFLNDSLIVDTYDKDSNFYFLTFAILKNDRIGITGYAGLFTGVGFYLEISENCYELKCLLRAEGEVYKYNQEDTTLFSGLFVPCSESALTLSAHPTFQEHDIVSGYFELKSKSFWEGSKEKDRKYRIELKAYFKTEETFEKLEMR